MRTMPISDIHRPCSNEVSVILVKFSQRRSANAGKCKVADADGIFEACDWRCKVPFTPSNGTHPGFEEVASKQGKSNW